MNNIEKEKYINAWKDGSENNSRTAIHLIPYLKRIIKSDWKILDLGCGNGLNVELLRQSGFNQIYGVDITLEGLNKNHPINTFGQELPDFVPQKEFYTEAPLWSLPFEDKSFDFTYSIDVMEHIPPEKIKDTIQEIYRITKIGTFHCIATFSDKRRNFDFHLIIQPIDKWIKQFKELNLDNINTEIIDRTIWLRQNVKDYWGL